LVCKELLSLFAIDKNKLVGLEPAVSISQGAKEYSAKDTVYEAGIKLLLIKHLLYI
jgi:hypothetical protein